jgi:serine/threonine-protein kinase
MGGIKLMKVNDIIDNRFKIISFIDEGGTALVYKAFDIIRKRDVALKVILQNISENEDYLTCFNIEASVLANFRHMNIVKIYSFGQYEEIVCLNFNYTNRYIIYLVDEF